MCVCFFFLSSFIDATWCTTRLYAIKSLKKKKHTHTKGKFSARMPLSYIVLSSSPIHFTELFFFSFCMVFLSYPHLGLFFF